jgi:uncharacterized protein YbjT (DUF2867 family)
MPHHFGKALGEDLVRRAAEEWTLLQPCAYVQNFVPALQSPNAVLEVAYDLEQRFGLVDLFDVAEAAATVLLQDGHHGATYELGGPELVSVADLAREAGKVLGRPVQATRVGREDWAAGYAAQGKDAERVKSWLLAMFDYYDQHGLPTGSLPLQALLGRRPTSVSRALARELRP